MAQNAQPQISLARGGPVTDEVLDELIRLAHELEDGSLSHEGGTLILQNLRSCLEELAKRRDVQRLIHAASDPDNVIYLHDAAPADD